MTTKPKVLISDKMDPNAARIFEERGCDVDVKPGMTPDELKAVIGEYDGLAIRSATKVTKEIIDAATNLKVIGRAGIGVDNVDIPYASSKGIVVMNTPFGNSITTAEHAIALMFALARQLPEANAQTQAGLWPKNGFMGVEVTGKTLGLIGAGNIGSIVADRALGLRMKVVAYDPFLSPDRAIEMGVEKVELDELLARTVDDAYALLGLGEVLGREDVARLVGQRRVQGDEVGAREQLIELDFLDAHLDRPLLGQEGVVGDDLHLQA